jgi:osmoprotectant transport system ATP-binding protein
LAPFCRNHRNTNYTDGLFLTVKAEELSFWHRQQAVLQSVTFSLAEGETVALLGKNGSGKSTFFKLVQGMLPISDGQLEVLGKPIHQWEPIQLRRSIGFAPQDAALLPHWNVLRNTALVLQLSGMPESERDDRARYWLRQVDLDPAKFCSRFPSELSGGERQRVSLARALSAEPKLLLLDEPFSATDTATRRDLLLLMERIKLSTKCATLLVTHSPTEALRLADRVAVLQNGMIAFDGGASDFPQSEWSQGFWDAV